MSADASSLTVRRATTAEVDDVVAVCSAALGWGDGGVDADYFRWKHQENPFGKSPIWVAEDVIDGRPILVGARAMMCWELVRGDGEQLSMVRAVDTATLPSHQGRGIFTMLTRTAVDRLTEDGVAGVFNTPNDKSMPGYLKMGWEVSGQLPIRMRARRPRSLLSALRARTAANKWGEPTDVGLAPAEALADREEVERAIGRLVLGERWATALTVDYLRWRSGFGPLACRVAPLGDRIGDGFVVFRIRERGGLRQVSLLHLVAPSDDRRVRRLIGSILRDTDGDVALLSGPGPGLGAGLIPLPRVGPVVTWRPLADPVVQRTGDLSLDLGSLEMF